MNLLKHNLYDELNEQKENGETLNLSDITFETMRQLWWTEAIPDSMLADLFNIEKNEFTKYRHKLKVKQHLMSAIDLVEKVKKIVAEQGVIIEYRF